MPAAYSEDLRWRVVWHKFLLLKSDEEIACQLCLSPRTVMRICHQFAMTGSVLACKTGRPVGTTALHQHEEYILLEAILNEPATRLHQLATTIQEQTGSEFDISTLCRALHRLGFTNKKVKEIAAQRRDDLRAQFRADMQNHRPQELVFIDETGFDRCLSRKYGYSPKGQRAEVKRIRTKNKRITVISAIGHDGYLAVRVLEPGQRFNRFVFAEFLRNEIVPLLNPYNGRNAHSVIVLGNSILTASWTLENKTSLQFDEHLSFYFADNHAVHHVAEVAEIIYGAGALLRFLPPYSPDFNPIEGSYHQAKDFVRENDVAYRCCTQPRAFILYAFGQISGENCENYFRNCGYQ